MGTLSTRLSRIKQREEMLARWRFLERLPTCTDEELMRALAPDCHPVPLANLTNSQLLRIYNGEPVSSVLAP